MHAQLPALSLDKITCQKCDGRGTINFPVVGIGHRVTALWSAIKRTRQIGRGAPVHGRAWTAGPDKDRDGDAVSHNSVMDKRPGTAQQHHSNTYTQAHTGSNRFL